MFQMDRDTIARAMGSAPLNTDDNMRIEYSAPLNLHRDTYERNMVLLLKHASIPRASFDADGWGLLAEAYERRGDSARAMLSYNRAIELAPGDSVQREALREALREIVDRVRGEP